MYLHLYGYLKYMIQEIWFTKLGKYENRKSYHVHLLSEQIEIFVVSVHHSVHRRWGRGGGRGPTRQLHMMHWTSAYRVPLLPLGLTSGGQDWKPVQTCSLEEPPPPPTNFYWHLVTTETRTSQAGSTHSTGMFSCCMYQGTSLPSDRISAKQLFLLCHVKPF